MKLSESGEEKIRKATTVDCYSYHSWAETDFDSVNLEPKDIEGAVILSIKEAEEICLAMNPSPKDCHLRDSLAERIAKAREVNE